MSLPFPMFFRYDSDYNPYVPQFQRPIRYMMVEVNGHPTQIPIYTAEDYHLPDTGTNSPKPGETPEETERRKAAELSRSRIRAPSAKRSASQDVPYFPYLASSPNYGDPIVPTHPSFHPQEVDLSYYPSTSRDDRLGYTAGVPNGWAQQAAFPSSYTTSPTPLSIDTRLQNPYGVPEPESSLSSALSYKQASPWSSTTPDSHDQDSHTAVPDTPSEMFSPVDYLPPPSLPVDLLSLPPRESEREEGSRSPTGPQYRTIHPRQDAPSEPPHQAIAAVVEKAITRPTRPNKVTRTACRFCRGRKIACGPPPPGGDGRTCNQCLRRSLTCEYPEETVRSHRPRVQASRDPSVKIGRPPKVAVEPRLPGENEPIPVRRNLQSGGTSR